MEYAKKMRPSPRKVLCVVMYFASAAFICFITRGIYLRFDYKRVIFPAAEPLVCNRNRSVHRRPPGTESKTEISDVFIGVKTTRKYHSSRLQLILDTWYSLAPEEIYFFTDVDDSSLQEKTNGHIVNTGCGQGYAMPILCCKLSIIISMFHETGKRWLCHVDDDNYLNVPNLVNLLRQYDHNQDHYIGRESLPKPKVVVDSAIRKEVQFWFATGGAGVCYSRALISKMMIYASKENFQKTCARIGQPDDVTIGFIVESLLNRTLTKVCTLNSHLQTMADIPVGEQKKQVTFGYDLKDLRLKGVNVINMTAVVNDDPTRLKSFHCTFFRGYGNCPEIIPEPPPAN